MNLRYINSNLIRKRIFLILVVIVLLIIFVYTIRNEPKNCFLDYTWDDGKTLPDVSGNVHLKTHSSSKNIFFHETSCNPDGVIKLNPRQACAIESAGKKKSSSKNNFSFDTVNHLFTRIATIFSHLLLHLFINGIFHRKATTC